MFRRVVPVVLALAALALAGQWPCTGQTPSETPGSRAGRDSASVHDRARDLQARFERLRVRRLSLAIGGGAPRCDEIIGRLCIWDDGADNWTPKPEHAETSRARRELLDTLTSLARAVPGDHWLFGQRIRYGVEAGIRSEAESRPQPVQPGSAADDRLNEAELLARSCGLPEPWRCDAYLGFVLHQRGRTVEAEHAFARALADMPAALRQAWTDPEPVLGRELAGWLEAQRDTARALDVVWLLADPLFLAPGNDRRTAHFSRWTRAMALEGARNPHRMPWGDDMAEVLVRYGWPVGWERHWPRAGQRQHPVTGRDAPAATRTFPDPAVFGPAAKPDRPDDDAPVPWTLPEGHARTSYLPPYLDSLGSLDGQIGRFWRGGQVVLVAAARMPPDTPTVQAGLFLVATPDSATAGGVAPSQAKPAAGARTGAVPSADLALDVRAAAASGAAVRLSGRTRAVGWGVASLEAWWPKGRRAYRVRAGLALRPLPPDLFALSDLVLLEPETSPADFHQLLPSLRASTEVGPDETLGVAFELYGLGYRAESVEFQAWIEDRDPGVLRRLARRLGLAGPPAKVALQWSEAGPDQPRPFFRAFQMRLPNLAPGRYQVVVRAAAPGRAPLQRRRDFVVPDRPRFPDASAARSR